MGSVATIRVLGVDPGTLRLGFGLLSAEGSALRVITSGVASAPASWAAARRLGHLARAVEQVIDAERPDCLALEASFYGENAHSLIRLGEARGMVLALAGARGLEVHDYPPATVKKSVTGHGGASKEQVARVLAALMPDLGRLRDGDRLDQTDAIAVAWCHLRQEELRRRMEQVAKATSSGQKKTARRVAG